jgi:hypothetical protein
LNLSFDCNCIFSNVIKYEGMNWDLLLTAWHMLKLIECGVLNLGC